MQSQRTSEREKKKRKGNSPKSTKSKSSTSVRQQQLFGAESDSDRSTSSSDLNDEERTAANDDDDFGKVSKTKFSAAASELREQVMKEVMSSVMPDIGAYNIDGMVESRAKPSKGLFVKVAKAIGIKSMDIHEAVLSGSTPHLAKVLKKLMTGPNANPSYINQYDELGQTALSIAVKTGSEPMTNMLIENNALVDICDESTGRTPLMFSIINRTHDISSLLLQARAEVDLADFKCITPLMLAANRNDVLHCKMLLAKLADVDLQDDNGWTALHYAADGDAPNALELLLGEGAERTIKDNRRRKALDIAKFKKYMECIAELSIVKDLF